MPWIPPPSISVCRCFPGQGSAVPKPQSRCIPCSTCTAAFPRLSALQKAKPTTSISLISSFPKSVRSMSWIAATSILTPLPLHALFRILCRPHQRECLTPAALLPLGGQVHRCTFRSHRHPYRDRVGQGISRDTTTCDLLRRREPKAFEISDQ